MCLTVEISENGRHELGMVISMMEGMLSVTGVVLVVLSIYMKAHLESKMALMVDYDPGEVPWFLLGLGITMFVLSGLFAKAAHASAYPETRPAFQNILILFIALKFVLMWVILAGSIMTFTHQAVIRESFRNGITSVMKRYKKDLGSKVMMDGVQASYRCCGSEGYLDWVKTNWISDEYLDITKKEVKMTMRGGLYYSDDTPYSCCNVSVPRPCIHHDIRNKSAHVNYGTVTLYERGCTGELMYHIDNVIMAPTAYMILVAFVFEMLTCMMLRLLQTSIRDAFMKEEPLDVGIGYCPCTACKSGGSTKQDGDFGEEAMGRGDGGGGGGGGGGLGARDLFDMMTSMS